MKSTNFILLVLGFSVLQIIASATSCKVPSRFWCNDPVIAWECGVYEQCRKSDWTLKQDADPVEFTLYYESLCPDCKRFISQMLYPTYNKLSDIMTVTLVPYGNAKEKQVGDHWEFNCQHGVHECEGNLIETCTIAIVKNISIYFPYIDCIERSMELPSVAAKKCANQFVVPLASIVNCTASDYGNTLEHEMAVKTDALQPSHKYVPWVTLNGVHTEEIQHEAESDLLKLVCETYKGVKPAACSQSSSRMHHEMRQ